MRRRGRCGRRQARALRLRRRRVEELVERLEFVLRHCARSSSARCVVATATLRRHFEIAFRRARTFPSHGSSGLAFRLRSGTLAAVWRFETAAVLASSWTTRRLAMRSLRTRVFHRPFATRCPWKTPSCHQAHRRDTGTWLASTSCRSRRRSATSAPRTAASTAPLHLGAAPTPTTTRKSSRCGAPARRMATMRGCAEPRRHT